MAPGRRRHGLPRCAWALWCAGAFLVSLPACGALESFGLVGPDVAAARNRANLGKLRIGMPWDHASEIMGTTELLDEIDTPYLVEQFATEAGAWTVVRYVTTWSYRHAFATTPVVVKDGKVAGIGEIAVRRALAESMK